jgi:hypothetical protein
MNEQMIWDTEHIKNFVFIGEAGCGKSEIAVNLALHLLDRGRPVHLFDLDTTKPLFRTRDQAAWLERRGIHVHFEQQLADAPTMGGGVRLSLRDEDAFTILDVGGDYMGARSTGQYAPHFRREATGVYYIVNPFRPWSDTTERIDRVLSQILTVTHLRLEDLQLVGNPNVGADTAPEEFLRGREMLRETVSPYKEIEFYCAAGPLAAEVAPLIPEAVFPMELYFQYPWNQ